MPIAQGMLNELDNEARTTRALIALIPDADATWKPHPKSFSMGDLAAHITNMMSWGAVTLSEPNYNLAPNDGSSSPPHGFESTKKLLATFDENLRTMQAALKKTSDDEMMAEWQLLRGDEVLVTMPRVAAMRTLILNHLVHHRGQLSVYLRLRDIPLPQIYGPTADSR